MWVLQPLCILKKKTNQNKNNNKKNIQRNIIFVKPFLVSCFCKETNLNWYLNPCCPQRLLCSCCLPFAALWSSISWLGELQLWYLTGQQITAPLKALWEWPIVHLWERACSWERIPLWLSGFIEAKAYSSLSWLLCHICKWWKWDCELQRIFLLRSGRCVSPWVCLLFFPPAGILTGIQHLVLW